MEKDTHTQQEVSQSKKITPQTPVSCSLEQKTQVREVKNSYDDSWYQDQILPAYRSAKIFLEHLHKVIKPKRVVDLGCGRGAWLKAFGEFGATTLVGVDGTWNSQEKMIDTSILFFGVDLNKPISIAQGKFDLAISLEVAEHLHPESAGTFIRSLTTLSNVVVFGAAYTGQGGTDHFNEQPHSYWAEIFNDIGYVAYDYFRPALWGKVDVEFWYRQNTFLYVKQGSSEESQLLEFGLQPISNLKWMNCIHPALYESKRQHSEMTLTKRLLFSLYNRIPKRLVPVAKKIKHFLIKPTTQQPL